MSGPLITSQLEPNINENAHVVLYIWPDRCQKGSSPQQGQKPTRVSSVYVRVTSQSEGQTSRHGLMCRKRGNPHQPEEAIPYYVARLATLVPP